MRDGTIARLRSSLKDCSMNCMKGFEKWKEAEPEKAYELKGAATALDAVIVTLAKLKGRMLDPYVIREECRKHQGVRGMNEPERCQGCKFCPKEPYYICMAKIGFLSEPNYWRLEQLEEALEKGRGLDNPWGVVRPEDFLDYDERMEIEHRKNHRRRRERRGRKGGRGE